jgi:hypothetical protein
MLYYCVIKNISGFQMSSCGEMDFSLLSDFLFAAITVYLREIILVTQ